MTKAEEKFNLVKVQNLDKDEEKQYEKIASFLAMTKTIKEKTKLTF